MDSVGIGTQQGASGDPHRQPVRVVGGQRVGDLARPPPTQIRRRDIAGGRPRTRAHVPAIGGVQITGGLQMLGDQRGILIGQSGSRPSIAAPTRRCISARSDLS